MDGNALRDGIFALNTRRFGSVAEVLVQRLEKLGKGRSLFHDLYDDVAKGRVEVKFSVARKQCETRVSEASVLRCIAEARNEERMMAFADWKTVDFDCNIQQIKRREFEVLYYGVFFADCIVIFRIRSDEIGPHIQYSDKQHKGNLGEGQFHINRRTMQVHLEQHLYRTLTYDQLLELLTD
ncbi:MAG TPA: hypothetical protein VND64_10205 [Pirellulales bacterium]|nr:hypothetical protein [Pirellulales bacterium]